MLSDEATRGDDAGANSTSTRYGLSPPGRTPLSRAQKKILSAIRPRTNKQIFLEFAPGSLACVSFAQGEVRQRTNPFAVVYGWFTGFGRSEFDQAEPMPAEFA